MRNEELWLILFKSMEQFYIMPRILGGTLPNNEPLWERHIFSSKTPSWILYTILNM
jgi:hypothetical protein